MEYLSQKQIAEKLGVSKQKVYRCIKLNHIKEALHETVKGNTVLMYDMQAIEQIKSILQSGGTTSHEAPNEVHHDTVNEALYEALLKQIDTKDKQIAELNERLAEAHKSLDQEQQLHLLSKQRILELESKEEPQDDTETPPEEPEKKWWKKIFK